MGGSLPGRFRVKGRFAVAPVKPTLPRFQGYVLYPSERAALVRAIHREPGSSLRRLADLTGLSVGKVRGHLLALVDEGVAAMRRRGATIHIYPASSTPRNLEADLERRDVQQARLVALVKARPNVTYTEIVAVTTRWGWPSSTTKHRLARLVKSGLLHCVDRGRYRA